MLDLYFDEILPLEEYQYKSTKNLHALKYKDFRIFVFQSANVCGNVCGVFLCFITYLFMKQNISLKDIARELNLSISTVSRALRGVGEISQQTRDAVNELARKYRYRPNPLATGLLKNKTKILGVILPEIESYYFSTILRGIDKIAGEHEYKIMAFYSNESQKLEEQAIEELLYNNVEGIITCPAIESYEFVRYQNLIAEEIPFVVVERDIYNIESYRVVTNNYLVTSNVIEYLIHKGRKNIALITCLEPLSVGNERYRAYKNILKRNGIPLDRELIVHGNLNISTSIEATRNLLINKPRVDAIIGNSDMVAMAAMKVIKENGKKIPDDIALVGFNDDPYASFLEPSLSSVSQPAYLMGMRAAEGVFAMIEKKLPLNKPEKIILDSALILRNSTP